MTETSDRELIADASNPLGLDGIEFIEYSTSKPQALGQVLEMMGFRPVARHRSREVLLYRQGEMNVIVNAHAGSLPRTVQPAETPVIAAIALRVRDAAAAYRHAIDRGAWVVPTSVEVMELNIPAIHGVGASRVYFVDRYRDFSIYDVDFTLIPHRRPASAGARRHALVRRRPVHRQRPDGGLDRVLSRALRIQRAARRATLRHPAQGTHPAQSVRQLFPAADRAQARHLRRRANESLQRVGLGTPDVLRR
jgi:4-hydroxyphenylpyruvate dioxygenase